MRIPDEIWDTARRIAHDRGEHVTDVVIRALNRYIRDFGEDDDAR